MTPFKERMNLYRAYRELNPGKNYWDWKASLEVPAMSTGGNTEDYAGLLIDLYALQEAINQTGIDLYVADHTDPNTGVVSPFYNKDDDTYGTYQLPELTIKPEYKSTQLMERALNAAAANRGRLYYHDAMREIDAGRNIAKLAEYMPMIGDVSDALNAVLAHLAGDTSASTQYATMMLLPGILQKPLETVKFLNRILFDSPSVTRIEKLTRRGADNVSWEPDEIFSTRLMIGRKYSDTDVERLANHIEEYKELELEILNNPALLHEYERRLAVIGDPRATIQSMSQAFNDAHLVVPEKSFRTGVPEEKIPTFNTERDYDVWLSDNPDVYNRFGTGGTEMVTSAELPFLQDVNIDANNSLYLEIPWLGQTMVSDDIVKTLKPAHLGTNTITIENVVEGPSIIFSPNGDFHTGTPSTDKVILSGRPRKAVIGNNGDFTLWGPMYYKNGGVVPAMTNGGENKPGGYTEDYWSLAAREDRHRSLDPTSRFNIEALLVDNAATGEEDLYWRAYLGLDNWVPAMNENAKTEWDDEKEAEKIAERKLPSEFFGTTLKMDLNLQAVADTLHLGEIYRNYDEYAKNNPDVPTKRSIKKAYDYAKKVMDHPGEWQLMDANQYTLFPNKSMENNEYDPLGMLGEYGMKWVPEDKALYVHDTYDFPWYAKLAGGIKDRPREMKIRGKINFNPEKGAKLFRNK